MDDVSFNLVAFYIVVYCQPFFFWNKSYAWWLRTFLHKVICFKNYKILVTVCSLQETSSKGLVCFIPATFSTILNAKHIW